MQIMSMVSLGELLDKITILEIKQEQMTDQSKRENVLFELAALTEIKNSLELAQHQAALDALTKALKEVNQQLWNIEDEIRVCEKNKEFGEMFIQLARSVYITNDKRASLKKEINMLVSCAIVEEKSYAPY